MLHFKHTNLRTHMVGGEKWFPKIPSDLYKHLPLPIPQHRNKCKKQKQFANLIYSEYRLSFIFTCLEKCWEHFTKKSLEEWRASRTEEECCMPPVNPEFSFLPCVCTTSWVHEWGVENIPFLLSERPRAATQEPC